MTGIIELEMMRAEAERQREAALENLRAKRDLENKHRYLEYLQGSPWKSTRIELYITFHTPKPFRWMPGGNCYGGDSPGQRFECCWLAWAWFYVSVTRKRRTW
jgi:hypothetical protein